MKLLSLFKVAAAAGAVTSAIALLSNATTVLTNVNSMIGWFSPGSVTDPSQVLAQNLPKTVETKPPLIASSSPKAVSPMVSNGTDSDGVVQDREPREIHRKLALGLPIEFTPELVITLDHIYGLDSKYRIGLQSPAWGNQVFELKPGGEPFDVTVNHVRYEILVRNVREDAQGNTFVDVVAKRRPEQGH